MFTTSIEQSGIQTTVSIQITETGSAIILVKIGNKILAATELTTLEAEALERYFTVVQS